MARRNQSPSTRAQTSVETRRADDGDRSPDLSETGIASFVTDEAISAAREVCAALVKEVLTKASRDERDSIAQWLTAFVAGTSEDDLGAVLGAIVERDLPSFGTPPIDPDDLLAKGWRDKGAYPYRNLMSRKSYERQKYRTAGRAAQASGMGEGLRANAWSSCSRAATPPARAARSSGSWSTSTPVARGSSPSRSPPRSSGASGTSSAMSSTSRPRGEIVLFDRSWYNRAGVERVMGFCTDDEYAEFLRQAPEFERNLARSGVHLLKFWFSVSRDEQRRRFEERQHHPLKQWKLSPIDLASLDKWDDYTAAKETMFLHTDTRRGAVDGHQVRLQEAGPPQRDALRAAHDALHGQGHRRASACSTRSSSGGPNRSSRSANTTSRPDCPPAQSGQWARVARSFAALRIESAMSGNSTSRALNSWMLMTATHRSVSAVTVALRRPSLCRSVTPS